MKKFLIILSLAIAGGIFGQVQTARADAPAISVLPDAAVQGEPVMIKITGVSGIKDVAKIFWNGKSLWFFTYENKPTALVGVDLNAPAGDYKISAKLENGQTLLKTFAVSERPKIEAPLGIPAKLGGNTPASENALVSDLAKENIAINSVFSANRKYWRNGFIYPIANPIVSDTYGYLRKTGYYTIPHKGADFHADSGTKVSAVNSGVVRLATESRIYGKTIAIDHGFGVISYYMHLSKINVKAGQAVVVGQTIGLSGATGYAESPHLHLSVKISGVSIDPIKFLELFR